MKTIFTLLLATTMASSAFAYNGGKLTVTSAGNNNVQVVIDGRTYQQQDSTIVLDEIPAGQHQVRVYRSKRSGRGNNNANDLLYSSTVYVKPAYHVDVVINRFGKALVDERDLRTSNRWDEDANYNRGQYGNDPYGRENNGSYNRAMNEGDFNALVQKIRSQWFGNGKLTTAKEGVTRSYVNTGQVRQLLQLMSTENDKLELAKAAYRNTVDGRNYYQLYDVFSFQSSRDELERYIRDGR